MTQKGVEEELKRLLVEKEKEIADYQDHLECLQSAPGYPISTAHIPNLLQNNGRVAKRAKPGFLLNR